MSPAILHALAYWLPAFLVSVTIHEAAHAWVALRGGDPTAYLDGQVSFSPWPHMKREPVGMVVVPLLTTLTQGWTMGWASAPYNAAWATQHPRRAAWMAAAGPGANLALALLAFALLRTGIVTGRVSGPAQISLQHLAEWSGGAPAWGTIAVEAVAVMLALNTILFAFNLLPLPPLDGAAAVTLLLPESAARPVRAFMAQPVLRLVGLLAAWKIFPLVSGPLFQMLIALLYPGQYSRS